MRSLRIAAFEVRLTVFSLCLIGVINGTFDTLCHDYYSFFLCVLLMKAFCQQIFKRLFHTISSRERSTHIDATTHATLKFYAVLRRINGFGSSDRRAKF